LLNMAIQLYQNKLLSNDDSRVLMDYLDINKEYHKLRGAKTMNDINNDRTDSIIRIRQEYVYKVIPKILEGRPKAEEINDFIPVHRSYWDTRNQAMVANIVKQIKINPNKRIVVLTGYSHRYYLMDALQQYQTELTFSLKN